MKKIFLLVFGYSLFVWGGLFDFKTIEKAIEAYENKEYDKSLVLLNSLADSKDSMELNYNLGNVYYKKGEYEKALEAYQNSKGVNPLYKEYNLGNTYAQLQRFDEAIEAYERALKIADDEDTKVNLEIVKKLKKEQKESSSKNESDEKKDQNNATSQDHKRPSQQEGNESGGELEDSEAQAKSEAQNEAAKKTSQELEYMLKKLQSKQMPTMMYGLDNPQRRDNGANPW